ncbi:hypothetical protein VUR80DRAFT_528 [Thermomyces stellatus]
MAATMKTLAATYGWNSDYDPLDDDVPNSTIYDEPELDGNLNISEPPVEENSSRPRSPNKGKDIPEPLERIETRLDSLEKAITILSDSCVSIADAIKSEIYKRDTAPRKTQQTINETAKEADALIKTIEEAPEHTAKRAEEYKNSLRDHQKFWKATTLADSEGGQFFTR